MEIQKPIPLDISDSDLDEKARNRVKADLERTRTLGEVASVDRRILDLLPGVIADRVRKVVPPDFELAELELKFNVEGKLFGAGVGGEVVAKLKKKGSPG